jgi:fermentation-respiration switch protein FrsA (DUF1100 family)
MISIALTVFTMLAVAYIVVALILFFMQSKFVFSPIRELPYTPAELGLDFEEVFFRTGDRLQLHGWFIPAPNSNLTILYCHGNGGNMAYFLDTVNFLNGLGLSCFTFDYRGYGASQGRPSENGTYLDARAAFRWLTKKKRIAPEHIVIFGWSLGGSIAAYLAGKVKVAGLVIDSTFTSYIDIGRKFYPYMPVRWFAKFKYPTIDYVRKVKCPVLVIHSRNDEVVPFEFGLKIYEAAGEPKEFIELFGGHNDAFLVAGDEYKKGWIKWLKLLKGFDYEKKYGA